MSGTLPVLWWYARISWCLATPIQPRGLLQATQQVLAPCSADPVLPWLVLQMHFGGALNSHRAARPERAYLKGTLVAPLEHQPGLQGHPSAWCNRILPGIHPAHLSMATTTPSAASHRLETHPGDLASALRCRACMGATTAPHKALSSFLCSWRVLRNRCIGWLADSGFLQSLVRMLL